MAKPDKNSKPAGVTVSTRAPKAKTIFVAGTFNDWNPFSHPLTPMGDGQWSLSLDLPAGLYEYKFIIDGEWCCEPGCDRPYDGCSGCVANEFGTMNRVLVVEGVAEQASPQRQLA